MASNITELFGYSPTDQSDVARQARKNRFCPFIADECKKKLRKEKSGVCTIKLANSEPVICCPNRLYAQDYKILKDVADIAFGKSLPLISGIETKPSSECVAVFGKGKNWGKELRLPSRKKQRGERGGKVGGYFVDWILARLDKKGDLIDFVAVEVQSIDTTGNYRSERSAYLRDKKFSSSSTAGLNWENVSKRILPQIIYKGHALRREQLCLKGLFFVCPKAVYEEIIDRLGQDINSYPVPHHGSLTILWYDLASKSEMGKTRSLQKVGKFTTTIDQVARAFVDPKNLPEPNVYEGAIRKHLVLKK